MLPIDSMQGRAEKELCQMNEQFAQKTTLGCIDNQQVCDQHKLDNIEISFSRMPDSPERVDKKTTQGGTDTKKVPSSHADTALLHLRGRALTKASMQISLAVHTRYLCW